MWVKLGPLFAVSCFDQPPILYNHMTLKTLPKRHIWSELVLLSDGNASAKITKPKTKSINLAQWLTRLSLSLLTTTSFMLSENGGYAISNLKLSLAHSFLCLTMGACTVILLCRLTFKMVWTSSNIRPIKSCKSQRWSSAYSSIETPLRKAQGFPVCLVQTWALYSLLVGSHQPMRSQWVKCSIHHAVSAISPTKNS